MGEKIVCWPDAARLTGIGRQVLTRSTLLNRGKQTDQHNLEPPAPKLDLIGWEVGLDLATRYSVSPIVLRTWVDRGPRSALIPARYCSHICQDGGEFMESSQRKDGIKEVRIQQQ